MLTNFDRVLLVLDDLDRQAVEVEGKSVDASVKSRLNSLSSAYSMLMNVDRSPIDYSSADTQIAYSFRCLASHGDLLYRTLSSAKSAVLKAVGGGSIKIACIGGGPGSDALGFIKFAERNGLEKRKIKFVFLDYEAAWKTVRDALFATFGETSYTRKSVKTDLALGAPWADSWSFNDADIFTFSFALSEVWAFDAAGGSVSKFIDRLISGARAGALFVYVDNGGDAFLPLAEKAIAERSDIVEVFSEDDTWMLIGGDEEKSTLNKYSARYDQSLKITGNVNRRIWKKI